MFSLCLSHSLSLYFATTLTIEHRPFSHWSSVLLRVLSKGRHSLEQVVIDLLSFGDSLEEPTAGKQIVAMRYAILAQTERQKDRQAGRQADRPHRPQRESVLVQCGFNPILLFQLHLLPGQGW